MRLALVALVMLAAPSCALFNGGAGKGPDYCVYPHKETIDCKIAADCSEEDRIYWEDTSRSVPGSRVIVEGVAYECSGGSTAGCPTVIFIPIVGTGGACKDKRLGVVQYEIVANTCAKKGAKGIATTFQPREVSGSGACN